MDWSREKNLILNMDETKETIVGFRKNQPSHALFLANKTAVEVVKSTKSLGVHTTSLAKRAAAPALPVLNEEILFAPITGTSLPPTQDIAWKHCVSQASNVIRDASHPRQRLFTLRP